MTLPWVSCRYGEGTFKLCNALRLPSSSAPPSGPCVCHRRERSMTASWPLPQAGDSECWQRSHELTTSRYYTWRRPNLRLKPSQSEDLRHVQLTVSATNFKNINMFGTELHNNSKGEVMDPCSGDSGGPLIYQESKSGKFVIIGKICILLILYSIYTRYCAGTRF